MQWENGFAIVLIVLAALASIAAKKLDVAGAFTGAVLAWVIYLGAGYTGLAMLTVFFIIGSLATSWRSKIKEGLAIAEQNKGKRNAFQVLANGGCAALMALLAWLHPPGAALFRLMLACSLAASLSDTLSSELGNVYGKRFYNILNFKKDARGLNGVISLEGTFFGIIGSTIIGAVYGTGFGWKVEVLWVILSGIIGNLSDSVLGATLERRQLLRNDAVNFLNNLVAAASGFLLFYLSH